MTDSGTRLLAVGVSIWLLGLITQSAWGNHDLNWATSIAFGLVYCGGFLSGMAVERLKKKD